MSQRTPIILDRVGFHPPAFFRSLNPLLPCAHLHALPQVATSPKVATVYCDGIATQYNEKVRRRVSLHTHRIDASYCHILNSWGFFLFFMVQVKALPATCPPPTKDFAGLAGWCLAEKIDLVVVGELCACV